MHNYSNKIFNIKNENEFNRLAIDAFNYQYNNVKVYAEFCKYLNIDTKEIKHYSDIPFLPIDFFKTRTIIDKNKTAETTFQSSGTTLMQRSKHHVADTNIYTESFINAFKLFYGNISDYCILALLPNYLEQGESSLVYMANELIQQSKHPQSGFYLNNYKELHDTIKELNLKNTKILLLGVSYALLDFAEQYPIKLNNTIVMETGGMKGRRKELTREELHKTFYQAFNIKHVHSEYGMTELLSQAYSFSEGIFQTPPWMKVIIRDTYDPFTIQKNSQTGGINIIDLANIHSCCFIETKDLGKALNNNTFTVLGRFDNSDIRGCNLLAVE